MGRCIGLDVHRDFAQVAIWEKGRVTDAGRVPTSPEGLREFTKTLRRSDRVALEATMNTAASTPTPPPRAEEDQSPFHSCRASVSAPPAIVAYCAITIATPIWPVR